MNLHKTINLLLAIAFCAIAKPSRAEEEHSFTNALSSTTLSGYVDTSTIWWVGSPAPVSNDYAASAVAVETNRVSIPSNLTNSTLEATEPAQPNQTGSVWYKWRANETGVARISITTNAPVSPVSAFSTTPALSEESIFYPGGGVISVGGVSTRTTVDGVVLIHTGFVKWWTSLAVYRLVQNSQTAAQLEFVQRGGRLEFDVQAGETFWISVEVYQGAPAYEGQPEEPSSLPTDLYFDLTPTPINDSFASNLSIADSAAGYLRGYTLAATREAGEPDLGGAFASASVWFHFTAATFGTVTIGLGHNPGPFAVFTGSDLSTLKLVAKTDSGLIRFFGEEGKVYHVAVYRDDRTMMGFSLAVEGPKYRLYETTVDALFPTGLTPHFYGVRGTTMLSYAKSATGWKLVEVEPIVGQAADLLIHPAEAVDGQLRVTTIDEPLPSPHVRLTRARGWLVDLIGIPGQTCAISYSTDLLNWSDPEVITLQAAEQRWHAFSLYLNYFFRVTQSFPVPAGPQNQIGVQIQTGGAGDVIGVVVSGPGYGGHGNVPPPPVPSF